MAEDAEGGGSASGLGFLLFLIFGLILIWFLSGAAKNADLRSIFLSPPPPLGAGDSIGLPTVDQSGAAYSSETDTITGEIGEVRRELESVRALPISPYSEKVSIISHSGGSNSAESEYVTIAAHVSGTEAISISDWRLESAVTKRSAYLRQGVELYLPGAGASQTNIILRPGDEATISTGRSTIGYSFKLNRCSGYLSQFQDFSPSLPLTCPYADSEARNAQSGVYNDNACMSAVSQIGQCRIEPAPSSSLSSACRSFISSTLTYQGCVNVHRADSNFDLNEWRVYLGYTESLWRDQREVLVLLDAQGKVVDTYSY
jgi:hypothetical protein